MQVQFLGAAREVTGSKHLVTTDKGKKILLDCGMFQGKGLATDAMNRDLGFDPKDLDYLFLTHPHIDHSGLIPYIVKLGFKGMIYCTPATRDLCSIMLADSGYIQESDTYTFNKKRARQGLDPVKPIYTVEDAQESMKYFVSIPYERDFFIDPDISVRFTDNGHILGSATVNLTIKEGRKTTRLAYTGDIGRYSKRILKEPQPFPQADYIIMESTYGDRLHDPIDQSEEQLLDAVIHTCVKKKGKLIIPSFAIGRAQEIIFALDKLTTKGLLPDVNVYVDSPLSINATNIMRLHTESFNDEIKAYMKEDNNDPFGFDRLYFVRSKERSKAINDDFRPMIIISSSGMMEAGRVKHHLANNIENWRTTILGVGYCAPSTLGYRILNGAKEVSIFGNKYKVKADIRTIDSYSAHADYKEMLRFLKSQNQTQIKGIFLVHGEEEVQRNFKRTLRLNGYKNIRIPKKKEVFEL